MFLFFSHHSKFCLIIFSVKLLFSHLPRLPSLPQSRELGPATTIPANLMRGEWDAVSFPLVFIFPHHFNFFSAFFQINCYSVGHAGCPHSLNQGNINPSPPSPPTCCMEKARMVSFPLVFVCSPPFQFISHSLFFQLNCYSVAAVFC